MRDVDGVDLEALSHFFAANRTLRHLWSEYRETLHLQTTVDPTTGVEKINAVRSTIPAEALSNTATLIEGRLFTEFFKHLPGVFTGIGIIGTFLGLIAGLRAFRISEEPSVVRESLNLLLHGVHEAFLVSAGVISLAMIVTVLEKFLLAALHRQVEGLSQRLDSLFEAGAGELVRDLKDILSELTDRQITAV